MSKIGQNITATHDDTGGRTAENRRAMFRASRENAISYSGKPKLVRAMSAPLRPIDSETWTVKRRNRTKRIEAEQPRTTPLYFENSSRSSGKDDKTNNGLKTRSKLSLKTNGDTIGSCDIVTLVSLLNPAEASDSEKEEPTQTKTEPSVSTTSPISRRKFEKSGILSYFSIFHGQFI